ncbi:conjugal transfer protein TraA [Streptomyces sp. WAC00469]|nr:conjugal transfer protein TraA [Streptomyces sp. WAC00469]
MLVQADEDRMISLPRDRIARALRVEDPDLVMVETDGLAHGVVTVYREHPLIHIREATVEDLTMRADGQVTIGLRHDGRPAQWPLWDPELGALTDLLVGAPGSGKSVTLLTLLAAERISGVVSVVADAQDGMSLPEAQGRTFHFGAGRAALGATLAAACAVADYREKVSAASGWGSFTLGDPWPLAIVTLDEINRVLSADADAHDDYRTWCTGMISRIQLTGRKLGLGIRFAGQSIHLADLGDSDKIRSGARQGTVWLGRVTGSMTQRMATDMTSGAIEVSPIPRVFGAGGASQVAAAWTGKDTASGPVTAGCAWLIQGGHPTFTRTFRAVKRDRTYPGLISLMETAPIPRLTPEEEEIFRAAYTEALPYAEALMTGGKKAAAAAGAEASAAPTAPVLTKSPATPAPPAPTVRPLRELILAALAAAGGPMRTRDIRAAVGVGTEGGPSAGTVGNALTALRDEGLIVPAGHGRWALPDHP